MTPDDLDDLILRALDDTIDEAGAQALNERLRRDAAARARYLALADQHAVMAVDEQVWTDRPQLTVRREAHREWWRSLPSAAAGLMIGLFASTATWAIAAPDAVVATVTRLVWLVDGGFENTPGPIPSGFPTAPGYWSGDGAELVKPDGGLSASEGTQVLRLVEARADAATANGPANSCDVFQVVDLRQLRAAGRSGELSLELSAQVKDARPLAGEPLAFTARLYVFSAAAEPLHAAWPTVLQEAQAVAITEHLSRGGPGKDGWKLLTTRCLLPPQADLAVIMLTCSRHGGSSRQSPQLGMQYVDAVTLSLHEQPVLPTRAMPEVAP
jgi:hypothetical protein